MQHRQQGVSQETAAAKAGISVRSGRRIETPDSSRHDRDRDWRTREEDPLEVVRQSELLPLLENEPSLTGTTLLEYLEGQHREHYDQRVLRSLQGRVKQWKALHGPDKEVIFRQQAVVAHFQEEQAALLPLPGGQAADYQTLHVKVTRSSTIEVRRVVYSVPSRLIGERVQVHDKLAICVGQQQALTLSRIYPKSGENRARSIDYKQVIRALASKPQAFRYSQLRDDLLPDNNYRQLWQYADAHLDKREACKWIVTVLRLAFEYDIESDLGQGLLDEVKQGKFATTTELQERFLRHYEPGLSASTAQHDLCSYDELLSTLKETPACSGLTPGVPF